MGNKHKTIVQHSISHLMIEMYETARSMDDKNINILFKKT